MGAGHEDYRVSLRSSSMQVPSNPSSNGVREKPGATPGEGERVVNYPLGTEDPVPQAAPPPTRMTQPVAPSPMGQSQQPPSQPGRGGAAKNYRLSPCLDTPPVVPLLAARRRGFRGSMGARARQASYCLGVPAVPPTGRPEAGFGRAYGIQVSEAPVVFLPKRTVPARSSLIPR